MTYPEGIVWFRARMVQRVGAVEKIRFSARWIPKGENRGVLEQTENMPEQEFLYSPGQDLKIPVEGYGNLEIKGKYDATVPDIVRRDIYPEYGKFRIDPPVLLVREKELLGKFTGGGGEVQSAKTYFGYGQQGYGWYLFSAKPLRGAVKGTITGNQIDFELDGKPYSLFTGDPIVFGSTSVWLKHYASIKDADPTSSNHEWNGNQPQLAFGKLENLGGEK
jgi:hypothetical protein